MQDLLEQAFDACLKGLYGEGRRLVKIQALSVALKAVRGARFALMLNYVIMCACFLWALSFFATGWTIAENWRMLLDHRVPPPLFFTLPTLALSTLALTWTVRERAWLRALGVEERVDELTREPAPEENALPTGLSRDEIAELIERAVGRAIERKLP